VPTRRNARLCLQHTLVLLAAALPAWLPAAESGGEPTAEYRVERGDTLIGLRGRVIEPQADWRRLQRLNRITNPRRLQPGSVLRIPASMLLARAEVAEVLYVQGQVSVQRAGQPPQPLASGASVAGGDRLVSAAQSSAVLLLADGSRLLLRPDSTLAVEQLVRLGANGPRQTRLLLDRGATDADVPSTPASPTAPAATARTQKTPSPPPPRHRLELRTPVVNLAVRGTGFRASAEAEAARLEVLEGSVAAGRTAVAAGFGTIATPAGVAPPRPLLPPPVLATVPPLLERVPVELAWEALSGAMGYRAQVLSAETPARLLLDGRFAEPRARWVDDLPDGRYELRVRAADAQGLEGRDATTAFVLKARPEAPFVVEPLPGAQGSAERVRFRWTLNPAASRYHLQIAADEAFQSLVSEQPAVEGGEASAALPLGRIHWRVRSIRGADDAGPWGAVQSYTRVPPPPPPAAPQSLPAQATDEGLRIAWVASPELGVRYQVQASRDAGFTQLLSEQTTTETSWLLPKPEPGLVYVRQRTLGADGRAGPWGSAQSIEVPRSRLWWLLALPLLLLL
jgi:hypothetical protein